MRKLLLIPVVTLLLLAGCKVNYSFQGGKLNEDIQTISIQYFESRAPLAAPNYSQAFTEALRDVFLQQTNLSLVDEFGDLQIEGDVIGYDTRPAAVTGNEAAALTRLTITVQVRCESPKDEDLSFEQSFKRFADFSASQNLADVEEALIDDINEQLTQDVFNKIVSDW